MNLASFAGIRNVSGEKVGIEIEVEALDILPTVVSNWSTAADNSLRGDSMEYKSRTPFALNNVEERVRTLASAIEKSKPIFSTRTSTHVHVNCLDMEIKDIFTGLLYSLLIESALAMRCAKHRRKNKFCTRFNYSYVEQLNRNLGSLHFNDDVIKYTAIAPHCLVRFGTIEFRMKEGTCDPKEVSTWATICSAAIRRPMTKWKNPEEMFEHLIETECMDILELMSDFKLDLDYTVCYDTLLMLMEFIYSTDWNQWDRKPISFEQIDMQPAILQAR